MLRAAASRLARLPARLSVPATAARAAASAAAMPVRSISSTVSSAGRSGSSARPAAPLMAACVAALAAVVGAGAALGLSSHTLHAAAADEEKQAPASDPTSSDPASGILDDDAGDVDEPVPFRSAQPYSDPTNPGLTLLVADLAEELVFRRDRPNAISQLPAELAHVLQGGEYSQSSSSTSSSTPASVPFFPYGVLLFVHDPSCSACSTLRPVLLAVADAFAQGEPGVRVMALDAQANVAPELVDLEELKELPLVKFYPPLPQLSDAEASSAQETPDARDAIVYTGPPNTHSLVDFIDAHTPADARSKDGFDFVRARLEATAASTDQQLRDAVDRRLREDPVFDAYAHSPCGGDMMAYMRSTMLARYVSAPPSEQAQKDVFDKFQGCMQKKDKAMRRYWEMMMAVAQDNLSKYEEKEARKQQ